MSEDEFRPVLTEEEDEYPSYPDRVHSTMSYFDSLVDHTPPVHTISCRRCGAYEHGDFHESEEEAERRFYRERGETCRDWWLARLAWEVMES